MFVSAINSLLPSPTLTVFTATVYKLTHVHDNNVMVWNLCELSLNVVLDQAYYNSLSPEEWACVKDISVKSKKCKKVT